VGTFNAGAIEATLTLDRTPFNKSMDAAQARAARFENKGINVALELVGWEDDFARVEALADELDSKKIDIPVNVDDVAEAAAQLEVIEQIAEKLDGETVNIDVDVDNEAFEQLGLFLTKNNEIKVDLDLDDAGAFEQLALFELASEVLDGKDIDVNIDVDGAAAAIAEIEAVHAAANDLDGDDVDVDIDTHGATGAIRHFNRFQAIVTAVLLLLPLVPPVAASATAGLMGLAAGFTAAAGGLGAVALGVAPTVKGMMDLTEEIDKQKTRLDGMKPGTEEYIKQQAKISELQKKLTQDYGEASEGLNDMLAAWKDFSAATRPVANDLLGTMFRTLADILPKLVPIFNAVAPVMIDMFDSISGFVDGPEMDRLITFFSDFGAVSLDQILGILGNLILMFGRLFEAFAPFGTTFLGAIEDVTAAWAEWADGLGQTQAFQDFIAYVMLEGPKIWELIKNIIAAFINLGVALAPVGTLALDVFNAIFSAIATMDPSVLGAITIAIMTIVGGILALKAVMSAFAVVAAANPFVLLAIAVIALVGAIVYLWNTNEGFREAIIGAWNAIVAAVQVAVDWFMNTLVPFFQSMWQGIVTGAMWLWAQVGPIFTGIYDIIVLVVQNVMAALNLLWAFLGPLITQIGQIFLFTFKGIWEIVAGTMKNIWSVISNTMNVIWTIIQSVMGVIITVFTSAWNIIRTIFISVINVIKSILSASLALMQGRWGDAWNSIKSIFVNIWNGIVNIFKSVTTGIYNIMSSVLASILRIVTSIFQNVLNVIKDTLGNALTAVSNIINNIKGLFGGAGSWLIDAGRRIIQGLIDGIRNAIGGVQSLLQSVTSWIPDWKGPAATDAKLLVDNGKLIMGGLVSGIASVIPTLRGTLGDITDSIPNMINANVNLSAAVTPSSLGTVGSNVYNLEVNIRPEDLRGLQRLEDFINSLRQQIRQQQGVEA
jgi:phage-related protein